jgi:hypothetical protein
MVHKAPAKILLIFPYSTYNILYEFVLYCEGCFQLIFVNRMAFRSVAARRAQERDQLPTPNKNGNSSS